MSISELNRIPTDKPARIKPGELSGAGDDSAYYAAVLDSSDDAIVSKDLNGIILSWNPGAARMFGYTAEEAIGRPVSILIPRGREDEEPAILERVRRGERIDHYETVRQRKDGSRLTISLTVSPIRDDHGRIIGASKIARDITDRKRAEDLRRHFAAIVESSDDAIIGKDLNGIIQSWNQGAQRIFGYTEAEAVGQPVTILIPAGLLDEEPQVLARIRRGDRIDHYETIRQRKDGSLIQISLTVSPIKDDKGNVIGASKIARDITARKQAEEALRVAKEELAGINETLERRVEERTASLREAMAQMEEFSYTVSHDLRAPARAMRGYAEIVLGEFGQTLDPQAKDYLERIIRGGDRMDRLVQDVLTYSRLRRRELVLQPVPLDRVVSDVIRQYPSLQHPNASLTIQAPLLPVRAYEPSLAQAVSNLLTNAAKFVAPGKLPRITVRTEPRGDKVRLWVEDNGIGIPPEHQHRIFGIFERLPTALPYEGTGIGLAIVRKAVEKMGGEVGLESKGVPGARFWVELPAAELSLSGVPQPHSR
jgi:PAS domain S-box-containing protein